MKKKTYLPALLGPVLLMLVVFSPAVLADESNPEKHEEVKREMLSTHETIAEFQGLEYRVCQGKTGDCPEKCGSSGEFAIFKIVNYLKYEKPGQYGDPKQQTYRIHVTDFHRKPIDEKLGPIISKLKKGDKVMLAWRHDYLTTESGSKYADRVVTKLQKMEDE